MVTGYKGGRGGDFSLVRRIDKISLTITQPQMDKHTSQDTYMHHKVFHDVKIVETCSSGENTLNYKAPSSLTFNPFTAKGEFD